MNARLRAEKSKAKPFTRVDLFAFNALGGQIFGQGGGDEGRRGQFYGALRARLGNSAAKTLFDDLSEQSDADTPTTLTRKAPYGRVPRKPSGNAILDAGSLRRTLHRGRERDRERAQLGQQLPDRRSPALDARAIRCSSADRRSATSTPASRSRPTCAGPATRRAASTRPRTRGRS